ncbi:MAG: foldase protein PrsA [Candidatus Tyrphobacter sp.]
MSNALRIVAGSITLLLCATLAACGGSSVATVDGQAISRQQFDQRLESTPIARNVLQQMVQEALINHYASTNHIAISNAQIAARENELKANYPDDAWTQMLAARGITEAQVHDALRLQLILETALSSHLNITDAQIAQYFNAHRAAFDTPAEVCASHILVPDLATADKVEALLKARGNGAFASLAQQYSVDPGSKTHGGSLGCFRHGQMVAQFDAAAFSLPVGKISTPVHTPYGYHIILVTSRQPATHATLASARSRILLTLQQQQVQPLIPPFLQGLQQQANIVVNDPQYAGLFPTPAPASPVTAAPAPASAAPAPAPSTH